MALSEPQVPAPVAACTASQVQTKLKLVGIEAVYLASSGERVTRLDQLQDIDELYVVEVGARCCMFLHRGGGGCTLPHLSTPWWRWVRACCHVF